jgi:restriction endonuclease S subunit
MAWKKTKLDDVLKYEQPTKYIVKSDRYNDEFEIPVLTAGKSFLLGYTNEKEGVFNNLPVIIFDDFTTAFKYVDFPFKVKSSAMKILKNDEKVSDIRFLFYLMHVIKINNDQHKRYWISKYSQLRIPLPKLATQKKIAAILDEADKIRQLNKELIIKYDTLKQSLFIEMFGDVVSNPQGWKTKTIEEIVKKEKYSLKRGPFGGALKKEIFVEKGYLVYEQYHALNNDFSFKRYFIDDKKFNELKAFEVKSRDLIISCSGVYLGKLAMIPENADRGIINQALLKVTLDEEKMRNDFFIFHFTQKRFRETFFDANRGAGVPNFPPMKEFKKFPFIYPPIKLQNQFAERVQIIENQKQQAQVAAQKSEDLFNSLLQKAFKGELVKE